MAENTSRFRRKPAPSEQVTDIVDSVKAYARQETLEPLRGAARWVAVGTLAAVSLGLSMVFVALGVLRLSQDLGGDTLDGSWSFLHYLITLAVVSVLVWISFSRISQRSLAKGE
jgi:hypothetical protein